MLRSDAALRNRVIAGVVLPFALLAIVLVSIGKIGSYVSWIWIPLILAGVLAGVLLDGAHKRMQRANVASADDEPVLGGTEGVQDGADVPDAGEVGGAEGSAEVGVGESSGQVDQP